MTLKSYAKINLILKILDRRPDGYHNLFSLFQRIDLWDELTFEPQKKGILIDSNCRELPSDSSNLVFRAADLLIKKSGEKRGIKIFIHKNIPVGAGLGGGSSNAATTLLELRQRWRLPYSVEEIALMGESIGSDIPFFCYRYSSAWVSGRGEIVHPVSIPAQFWILLMFPGFSIKTSEAYQQWDRHRPQGKNGLTNQDIHNKISRFQTLKGNLFFENFENDFEIVLFEQYPLLREIKNRLIQEKAEKVLLSGSGSTLFGIFSSEAPARMAEENLKKGYPHGWVKLTRCI